MVEDSVGDFVVFWDLFFGRGEVGSVSGGLGVALNIYRTSCGIGGTTTSLPNG